MLRAVAYLIGIVSFVTGVVGWITFPDDAALWPKRLRPLAMALGPETITQSLFAVSFICLFWLILSKRLKKEVSLWLRKLQFDFPEEINLEYINSIYRKQKLILVQHGKLDHPMTYTEFYIGVRNTWDKSINNVRVFLEETDGFGAPVRTPLLHVASQTDGANIQPGSTEFFLFVSLVHREYVAGDGVWMMDIKEAVELSQKGLNKVIISGKQYAHQFHIREKTNFYLMIYADDTVPIHGRFLLRNSNGRATLHFMTPDRRQKFAAVAARMKPRRLYR